uniref:Uncharacterized protein n=1 Tax=Glossina austeni TaxID=7395 RepID=A0A1A9UW20_GLOAU
MHNRMDITWYVPNGDNGCGHCGRGCGMFVLPRVPRKLLPPGDIGGPNKVGLPIATGDGKEGLRAPDAKGGGLGAGADQAELSETLECREEVTAIEAKKTGFNKK